MKELLRSNDAVLLSYVSALLEEDAIGFMVADANMSVLEGSIGILPRRILVESDKIAQARRISHRGRHRPCHRQRQRLTIRASRALLRPPPRLTTSSAAASAWFNQGRAPRRSDAVWLQAAVPAGRGAVCSVSAKQDYRTVFFPPASRVRERPGRPGTKIPQ